MKKQRPLRVGHAERMLVDLRIHVAVRDEDILPAVVIKVEELHAKSQKRNADGAEIRGASEISKVPVVVVVKQVVAVVGEISFRNVGPAVVIVVGGIDAHARLLASIAAVSDASFGPNFGESAFAVAVVEHAGSGVIGDIRSEEH